MKYFNLHISLEQNKERYRKLCFDHHPDRGGRVEIMQEINAEWRQVQQGYMAARYPLHGQSNARTQTHTEERSAVLYKGKRYAGTDVEIMQQLDREYGVHAALEYAVWKSMHDRNINIKKAYYSEHDPWTEFFADVVNTFFRK